MFPRGRDVAESGKELSGETSCGVKSRHFRILVEFAVLQRDLTDGVTQLVDNHGRDGLALFPLPLAHDVSTGTNGAIVRAPTLFALRRGSRKVVGVF